MNFEVSASLYSVVTQRKDSATAARRQLEAYLYDHTTIVGEPYCAYQRDIILTIVKTTVVRDLAAEAGERSRLGDVLFTDDLIKEAFYLANYQLNRILSGGFGGILAGSLEEAQQLLAETVVA